MDRLIHARLFWRSVSIFGLLLLIGNSVAWAQDIVVSEIMRDPEAVADDNGEYVEVYNPTTSDTDLNGWTLRDSDSDSHTIQSSVTVPAEGFAVLCRNEDTSANGGVDCAYEYSSFILANGDDEVILENGSGGEVDRVEFDDGTNWPDPAGASIEYTGAPNDDNNQATNWDAADTRAGDFVGDSGDFGSPNANATDGQLPVELVSFQATIDGRRALLTWRTASEQGNERFEVQHQGPTASGFRTVGVRDGAGTTTQPQSYQFETERLSAGRHTFRLRQVDVDGDVHYSDGRTAEVQGRAGLGLEGPNPLRRGQAATVVVRVDAAQEVRVTLYNVLGEQVRTLSTVRARPGQPGRVRLRSRTLPSGLYLVQAHGASFSASRRITIVR